MEFVSHFVNLISCAFDPIGRLFFFKHAAIHQPADMGRLDAARKILDLRLGGLFVEDDAPSFGADLTTDGVGLPFRFSLLACLVQGSHVKPFFVLFSSMESGPSEGVVMVTEFPVAVGCLLLIDFAGGVP